MRSLFFLIFFTINLSANSQNLVPNPGFEKLNTCNINYPLFLTAIGTSDSIFPYVPGWFNSHYGGADIFNTCYSITGDPRATNSVFTPRSGNGYAGFGAFYEHLFKQPQSTGWREWIQTKLLKPMQAGCIYEVTFYVQLQDTTFLGGDYGAIEDMGVYISDYRPLDSLMNFALLTPQVQNTPGRLLKGKTYHKISGLYTAAGGEEYLTFGNFTEDLLVTGQQISTVVNDSHYYAYYHLDDVSVIPVTASNYSLNLGNDTIICSNQPLNLPLQAQTGFDTYLWSTGDTSRSITVTAPGTYWVNADFGCGFLTDTITIRTPQSIQDNFKLPADTVICDPVPFSFPVSAPAGFNSYVWSTGETSRSINISQPGTYMVTAAYACGSVSDTIIVEQILPLDLLAVSDTTLCPGQTFTLQALNNLRSYQWSTGDTTQTISISQPGTYRLTAITHQSCPLADSVIVRFTDPVLPFRLPADTLLCQNETLEIKIDEQSGVNYTWQDRPTGSSRHITEPGTYTLTASNRCQSFIQSVKVGFQDCGLLHIPNIISPNNDGLNDFFVIKMPTARTFKLSLYNRWGQQIFTSDDYRHNWPAQTVNAGLYYYHLTDSLTGKQYKGWLEVVE